MVIKARKTSNRHRLFKTKKQRQKSRSVSSSVSSSSCPSTRKIVFLCLLVAIINAGPIGIFLFYYSERQSNRHATARDGSSSTTTTSIEQQMNIPKRNHQTQQKQSLKLLPSHQQWWQDYSDSSRQLLDDNNNNNNIRRWGCQNSETPFVFIHIGKAGGGTVRQRIAVSRWNLTIATKSRKKSQIRYRELIDKELSVGSFYPVMRVIQQQQQDDDKNGNTVGERKVLQRAILCNSGSQNYRPAYGMNTYEGTKRCNATTPIGQAIACHHVPQPEDCLYPCQNYYYNNNNNNNNDIIDTSCPIVYLGHNMLGSELHWLSANYFQTWWKTTWGSSAAGKKQQQQQQSIATTTTTMNGDDTVDNDVDDVASLFQRMVTSTTTASRGRRHDNNSSMSPTTTVAAAAAAVSCWNRMEFRDRREQKQFYESCLGEWQAISDAAATREVLSVSSSTNDNDINNNNNNNNNWAAVYASLPVLRATVLREPFSWLSSKYMWHLSKVVKKETNVTTRDYNISCDDIATATQNGMLGNDFDNPTIVNINRTAGTADIGKDQLGWVRGYSLVYLFFLCGEDCIVRYHNAGRGQWQKKKNDDNDDNNNNSLAVVLNELEAQAAANLRNSFTVVGLLNESDVFFDMITARVQYINMTLLPRDFDNDKNGGGGGRHRSKSDDPMKQYCESKFTKDTTFRAKLLEAAPELRALVRLFRIAEEVNRFQIQELEGCNTDFAEAMKLRRNNTKY